MLEKIEYVFQENQKNMELFDLFSKLFKDIEYVKIINEKEIHIISSNLKPKTIFKIDSKVNNIQLNIENAQYINLLNKFLKNKKVLNTENSNIEKLSIRDVLCKLKGHVLRIDHTGINLPSILYSKNEWNDLLTYFSSISNIYNYPTGELWPFLLPATEEENISEINNFQVVREPRFELVYDNYTNTVTIHIDIETDLSKNAVEILFPNNQGIYFKNLENMYKAIYLDYNEYLDIRLDVRFKSEHNDFETGEWFVSKGNRIK